MLFLPIRMCKITQWCYKVNWISVLQHQCLIFGNELLECSSSTYITNQSWLRDRVQEVEKERILFTLRILVNFFLTISAYLYLKQLTSRSSHIGRLHNTERQEIVEVLWPGKMRDKLKFEISWKNYLQETGIHVCKVKRRRCFRTPTMILLAVGPLICE